MKRRDDSSGRAPELLHRTEVDAWVTAEERTRMGELTALGPLRDRPWEVRQAMHRLCRLAWIWSGTLEELLPYWADDRRENAIAEYTRDMSFDDARRCRRELPPSVVDKEDLYRRFL